MDSIFFDQTAVHGFVSDLAAKTRKSRKTMASESVLGNPKPLIRAGIHNLGLGQEALDNA